MSINLTNAAVTEFDNEVKHEYQGMGNLRTAVSLRTNVVGGDYRFTRMGKGMANQKAVQADVTPMDVSHARQVATLLPWIAPAYTDMFSQQEVNFDERQELAHTIAGALRRREDQLIIDSMSSVTFAATNDLDADTGRIFDVSATSNFSLSLLRDASEHMNDIESGSGMRHIALRAGALKKLLEDTEVTGSDFNTVKALVNGEIDEYVGFKFHVIGSRAEGGLPGAATDRVAIAWSKQSVGLAVGIDMKTSIDWVPHKTSWLANGFLKAGAVAREPQGIIKLQYDETA